MQICWMNLVIDQGNTQFKAGLFIKNELIKTARFYANEFGILESFVGNHKIERIIISSVVHKKLDLSFLENVPMLVLTHDTLIPISNTYKTPQTLGLDRLANAVAANHLNKNGNSLVIDLGTCIKYDLVTKEGVYIGGNIAPGLAMRFQALNEFTAQLPLLNVSETLSQSYGTDTESSLQCGVKLGISHEIKGFIKRYKKEFNQLTIFMTGGDLKYFDKTDKKSIFADSNLTLVGLNEILNYNA